MGTRKIEETLSPSPTAQTAEVEGSLVKTPMPHLLHNFYTLRATGLLHLERAEVKKVVYLREGLPIFARSNLLRECLGQMLVKRGRLSALQNETSLRKAKEAGRLQGAVLVEMGLLSPTELQDALRDHVAEKLLDIFGWEEGTYRFIPAREFRKGITSVELSPAALILQGIRSRYPHHQMLQILLPHRHRYLVRAASALYRLEDLELSPSECRIAAECDGETTLSAVLEHHPCARREAEQLLAALLVAGIVESRKTPGPAMAPQKPEPTTQEDPNAPTGTILDDCSRMMQQDFFSLMGVSDRSGPQELRKAYLSLVKKFHPDRHLHAEASPETTRKINELFQRITAAYELLCDPARREKYLSELRGEKKPEVEIADVLQAETVYQKGMVFLRLKNYPAALEAFREAVRLAPVEPEYLASFAWALHRSDPGDPLLQQKAREALDAALKGNARLATAHLYLGQILKGEGRLKDAEKSFERAVHCDPNCTEALRELRLFELRREQKDQKGIFDRILRK